MPRIRKLTKEHIRIGSRVVIDNQPGKWGYKSYVKGLIEGTVLSKLDGTVKVSIDEKYYIGMVRPTTFYLSEIVEVKHA